MMIRVKRIDLEISRVISDISRSSDLVFGMLDGSILTMLSLR
jgi:hypothetical protein